MNADNPETRAPVANSAEELTRLLEIELMQKRADWQRKTARNKNLKSASLLFLFLVVLAGLGAFYFAFMRVTEGRQQRPLAPTTSARQP